MVVAEKWQSLLIGCRVARRVVDSQLTEGMELLYNLQSKLDRLILESRKWHAAAKLLIKRLKLA